MVQEKKLNEQIKNISNFLIFLEFFKLGCTSFGGPIAHISFFRDHFVKKKRWLDENNFLDIVSFSNFLPGPSSSQVGMCIGYMKKGSIGALLAWVGFTLPSAIIMITSAFGLFFYKDFFSGGLLIGIKASVSVIVFQAIFGMSKQYLNDYKKILITIFTALALAFLTNNSYQIFYIIFFGIISIFLFDGMNKNSLIPKNIRYIHIMYIILFFLFLLILPTISKLFSSELLIVIDKFYRTGSLVFGGGHIVLPLLQNEILNFGLVDKDTFIFGYGIAQIIPGPLFTFSGFLGSSMDIGYSKFFMGILSLTIIFLPSFLLVLGAMPYWDLIRNISIIRAFLVGVNACVIGFLISALYDPILLSVITDLKGISLLFLSVLITYFFKVRPWITLIIVAIIGKMLDFKYFELLI